MKGLVITICALASAFANAWGTSDVRIVRYENQRTGLHRVTSANLQSWSWRSEASWTIDSTANGGGIALYECSKYDVDASFLSTSGNCEGAYGVRPYLLGYISQAPRSGAQALYRCNRYGKGHFASTDPNCERNRFRWDTIVTEGPLGYVTP